MASYLTLPGPAQRRLDRLAAAVERWLALHARKKGVPEREGKAAYQELLAALREARRQ